MILDASAFIAALGNPNVSASFAEEDLVAPDLIVPEALDVLWKVARAGGHLPERAVVLGLLDEIEILPSRPFAVRAAELADRLDHPVYDCLYLAVALSRDDVLATADRRFVLKLATVSALRKHARLI